MNARRRPDPVEECRHAREAEARRGLRARRGNVRGYA